MKKFFIILGSIFGLIVLALILLPIIFKDDIRKAIDDQLAANLNAQVYYDADKFSLSLIRNFPNVSVRLGDFGVVGNEPFEGDTLVAVKRFELTLDFWSLFGDIRVNKIALDEPSIFVLVLPDGRANYDIAMPADSTAVDEPETAEASAFKLTIDRWEITNGRLVYYDQSMPFYLVLNGLNHSGSGDFEADVFDMVTTTSIERVSLGYDGVEYVTNKRVTADATIAMDLANMKFTFRENRFTVNNFAMQADGWVSMPAEDIDMDITFGGKDIDMKSVLSLIPGAYEEYLEGITAYGTVAFDGYVRGTYNDTSMPAVAANFQIDKGRIAMKDAPVPVENINLKAGFNYPSADLSLTSFNVDFGCTLAGEPSRLKLDFKNLDDYTWAVDLQTKADLEKLAPHLPLDGATLKGKIAAQLTTAGRMSDVEAERWEKLPTSGQLNIDGFLYQGDALPQGFGMSKVDAGFDPAKIELRTFAATAGKSDFALDGRLTNYLAFVLGKGEVLVGNLNFRSNLLDANEWMTEEEVPAETNTEESAPLEVVRIPQNIDFVLASNIEKLVYDNLDMTQFTGRITIRESAIKLDNTGFNLLGGKFTLAGGYDSKPDDPLFDFKFGIKELSIPESYKAFVTVQQLAPVAEKMTGAFSTDFRLNGALGQDMMPQMMSLSGGGLIQIADAALKDVKMLDAVQQVAMLKSGGNSTTAGGTMATLKDVLLSAEVKNGRVHVKPFTLNIKGNPAVISGSNGIDGTLDYAMAMKVPSGEVGQAVNQALSGLTSKIGVSQAVADFVDVSLGISGTYDNPKVKLLSANSSSGSGTSSLQATVKQQAAEKIAETKQALTEQATAKVDSAKAEVKAKVTEEVKKAEEEAKKKAEDKAKELLKKKVGG
jgi:uncharacterized protein involved in outer membrane biogenesis